MAVNNGRNKLFLVCNSILAKVAEPNIVKIKGHIFTGVYPSLVLMILDASKYTILSCLSNLKMRLLSHVSVIFTVIQIELKTSISQNAILDNFEEYYISQFDYLFLSV